MKVTWENAENGEIIGREKTKHTPGPWKAGKQRRIEALHNDKAGCLIIISERDINGRTFEEGCANTNLIAAAPDLLEACKRAYASLQGLRESGDEQDWESYYPLHKAYELCKAAIQKAEGAL